MDYHLIDDVQYAEDHWMSIYNKFFQNQDPFTVAPHVSEIMLENVRKTKKLSNRRKQCRLHNLQFWQMLWMYVFKTYHFNRYDKHINERVVRMMEKLLKEEGLIPKHSIICAAGGKSTCIARRGDKKLQKSTSRKKNGSRRSISRRRARIGR